MTNLCDSPSSGSAVRMLGWLMLAASCLGALSPPPLRAQSQPAGPEARLSPVFRASVVGPASGSATAEELGLAIRSPGAVSRSTFSSGFGTWLNSVSLEAGFRLSRASGAGGLSLDAGLALSLLDKPVAAGAGAAHNAIPLLGWDSTLGDGAVGLADVHLGAVSPRVGPGEATLPHSALSVPPLFPLTRALEKRDERNGSFVSLMRACFTSLEHVTSATLDLADDTEIFFGLGKAWNYGLLLTLKHRSQD